MDFYYGRMSGNSARSAFALYESGCEFNAHLVHTRAGENQKPDYLTVNPMGKTPSLTDGKLQFWESNAINLYVAEKNPKASLLPTTIEDRASVYRWLFFQAAHVTPACIAVYRTTNKRVQAFWNVQGDPQAAEAGRKELDRYFPVIDAALTQRDWLERTFSLADIAYAPHLWFVVEGGFDLAPWPQLRAWLERLLARPAGARLRT
jgi:glutathione S-transferase